MDYLQKFYDKAYTWLLTYGPKILLAVIALIAGQWLIKMFNRWLKKSLAHRRFDSSLRPFLQNFFTITLQVLLILGLMQILGIQMTVFAAVVGAFGVAAGFALAGTLQNFASGVLILFLRPYRVGDNIITQGQEGTVSSIQLFYTVVTTFDNKTVIVPNSKLSNEVIINLSREGKRRLDIEIKFSYAIEFDEIKTILQDSLASFDTILQDPPHRIGVQTLLPDGFIVIINIWIKPHGFQDAKLAFQEKILADLRKAGVKLPGMG